MDINKATAEQLEQAFQVDGTRAEYIIRKRDQLGGFSSWDQIKNEVPGFEDKMVENLQAAGLTIGATEGAGRGQQHDGGARHQHESHSRQQHESRGERHDGESRTAEHGRSRGISINEASREELERAFQVDGTRAEYIVTKRRELGGFKSWDQFKQVVPGFEDKMVENLEEAGFTLGNYKAA